MPSPSRQLIFETIHGSHLYGLAHGGSDSDIYRVYEGDGRDLRQTVVGDVDTVRGDLEAFLLRARSGSHQSLEALFSPVKQYGEGMAEKWGPFLDNLYVSGGDVFAKYERTIKKFCYSDFKRRRHAVRLSLNLRTMRRDGRFNPRLTEDEIRHVNNIANAFTGDDLKGALLD